MKSEKIRKCVSSDDGGVVKCAVYVNGWPATAQFAVPSLPRKKVSGTANTRHATNDAGIMKSIK